MANVNRGRLWLPRPSLSKLLYPPKFPLLEPMLHTRGKEGFKVGYRLLYRRLLTLYLLDALGKEVLERERRKRKFILFHT